MLQVTTVETPTIKKIRKNNVFKNGTLGVGRPTKIIDAVGKLEEVFRLGVNDSVACSHAGINRDTYYKWIASSSEFSARMEAAKNYAYLAATSVVVTDVVNKKSVDTAKWYLEKKHSKEYKSGNKMELTGEDGGPIRAEMVVLAGIGFLPPKQDDRKEENTISRPSENDATPAGSIVAGQSQI